jgi:hypothetical protein
MPFVRAMKTAPQPARTIGTTTDGPETSFAMSLRRCGTEQPRQAGTRLNLKFIFRLHVASLQD